jgi:hypothetical protein
MASSQRMLRLNALLLAALMLVWLFALAKPVDAALHPLTALTMGEVRRKARDIDPPYVVEWVVPEGRLRSFDVGTASS